MRAHAAGRRAALLASMAALLLTLVLSAAGGSREVEIRVADLPPRVRSALDASYHGATFLALRSGRLRGAPTYEAEMRWNGRRVDATFDAQGGRLEEETEIPIEQLPAAVRKGLAQSAQARWTLVRAERVQRTGQTVRYELVVTHGAARLELVYDAAGRRTSAERASGAD